MKNKLSKFRDLEEDITEYINKNEKKSLPKRSVKFNKQHSVNMGSTKDLSRRGRKGGSRQTFSQEY